MMNGTEPTELTWNRFSILPEIGQRSLVYGLANFGAITE